MLLPRDDTLIGCTAVVEVVSNARFHVNARVLSQSKPVTEAAARVQQQILSQGRLSPAQLASLLPKVKAESTGSCGGDGGCGTCDDHEIEDTCGSGDEGGCCSSSGGSKTCCGGDSDGSKKKCCGGGSGGCCSTSKKKKKEKKAKSTAETTTSEWVTEGVSTEESEDDESQQLQEEDSTAFMALLKTRWQVLCHDKISLLAAVTLVTSTAFVTTRVLMARK